MPLPLILAGVAAAAAVAAAVAIIITFDEEEDVEYRVEFYKKRWWWPWGSPQIKSLTMTRRSKTSIEFDVSLPIPTLNSLNAANPRGITKELVEPSLEEYFAGELGVSVSDIVSVRKHDV